MTSVLLIYPYFKPPHDRSIFRFPPLGLAYVAASIRKAGWEVRILDCTFKDRESALREAEAAGADVVGIYIMMTFRENALAFARRLRHRCSLLVAGGPLPSCDPASFASDFDIVVRGEGEQAMLDLLAMYRDNASPDSVPGITYQAGGKTVSTPLRPLQPDLDGIAFPSRELLPNRDYLRHWKHKGREATTTVMTTRGCPFQCEFCSSAIFGTSYRERSPAGVVDEVEEALSLGYRRIHFADDVFTLRKERVAAVCDEIRKRKLRLSWECLGRVDSIDPPTARAMKEAGCDRIFFGIESASDQILALMKKKISLKEVSRAVTAARDAGLKTGGFFILCYPGETDDTVLDTIRFASSLPLDYLSFTLPYPIPGTPLYDRVRERMTRDWNGRPGMLTDHSLTFDADFSELKMKFALLKGAGQFALRKRLGGLAVPALKPFELITDAVFRLIR